jgi:hypothetical protein
MIHRQLAAGCGSERMRGGFLFIEMSDNERECRLGTVAARV